MTAPSIGVQALQVVTTPVAKIGCRSEPKKRVTIFSEGYLEWRKTLRVSINNLCRMSGGHIRNLLILLRSSCDWLADLPVTRAAAEQSVRGMSNDFERALNSSEFFGVLRQVDNSQSLPGSEHDQLLLYNLSILEYEDGNPCYFVNPAVRALAKFGPPPRARSRRAP